MAAALTGHDSRINMQEGLLVGLRSTGTPNAVIKGLVHNGLVRFFCLEALYLPGYFPDSSSVDLEKSRDQAQELSLIGWIDEPVLVNENLPTLRSTELGIRTNRQSITRTHY